MNRYYFLAQDYRYFERRLDEIERMIRELSEKDGDTSRSTDDPYYENFLYTEHSRSQFKWCRRLLELLHIRDNAKIISPEEPDNLVLPGKRATYRMGKNKSLRSLLVGSYLNFTLEQAVACSHPVARKLLGKKPGETCTVKIHDETIRLFIVGVKSAYPTV